MIALALAALLGADPPPITMGNEGHAYRFPRVRFGGGVGGGGGDGPANSFFAGDGRIGLSITPQLGVLLQPGLVLGRGGGGFSAEVALPLELELTVAEHLQVALGPGVDFSFRPLAVRFAPELQLRFLAQSQESWADWAREFRNSFTLSLGVRGLVGATGVEGAQVRLTVGYDDY